MAREGLDAELGGVALSSTYDYSGAEKLLENEIKTI
mgnify:FL=1